MAAGEETRDERYTEHVDARVAGRNGSGGTDGHRSSTVFDDVFRTMLEKMPELVVPLANEAFNRRHPSEAPVVQCRNEHVIYDKRVITDSFLRIGGEPFHIECQSVPDVEMPLRMVEYDLLIALGEARNAGAPYLLRFPESCVLYLRDPKLPDGRLIAQVELPGEQPLVYEARVIATQDYGMREMFEKRLIILVPFYIMRYEKQLDEIAGDEMRTARLLADLTELRARLERETAGRGQAVLYEQLVELFLMVSDHVLRKHETLRKKVGSIMGGQVLELLTDRVAAAEERAREAQEQAREAQEQVREAQEQVREAQEQARAMVVERLAAAGFDREAVLAAIGQDSAASFS